MTALSAGAVTVVPRQEPKRGGTCPARRSGQPAAVGLISSVVTWDEFGGIAWSVHNTAVTSHSQMCVQCRASTREHLDLLSGEFGYRSRGAYPSENLPAGILCLKHVASANRCGRAKVHVGVGTIEQSLNQDIRVSKPLCSRCALNVSFWGILWRSVSDLDARNLLTGKASP
jgi:hypothetical protein